MASAHYFYKVLPAASRLLCCLIPTHRRPTPPSRPPLCCCCWYSTLHGLLPWCVPLWYYLYLGKTMCWIGWDGPKRNDITDSSGNSCTISCVPMRLIVVSLLSWGIFLDSHALEPLKTRTVDVGGMKLSTLGAGTWSWGNRSALTFAHAYIHTYESHIRIQYHSNVQLFFTLCIAFFGNTQKMKTQFFKGRLTISLMLV